MLYKRRGKRREEEEASKHDYLVMRVIKKGGKDIVFCNTCKKYLIADKADKEVEEWYKEHNKEHTKGIVEGNTPYIPNYKGDKKRVYCLICKESCYPSLNGKIPESKEELDIWYNEHASLFHENEELIPVDISKIEEKKENSIEKVYKCDICNALYREKSNVEKHLKYLHGINDKKFETEGFNTDVAKQQSIEPIEIDFQDNKKRSNGNKFGIVIDKKSKKSIVSLVKEGDHVICKHCSKQYNNMLELAEHIKAFSNTNAEDWVIEGGRDLLSFL